MDLASPLQQTVAIVQAFVAGNTVPARDLPDLIGSVHGALVGLSAPTIDVEPAPPAAPTLPPGVTVKKSIQPEYLICLEDGKRFRSLKRHLRSAYGLSPDDYRQKWALGPDYPMVAPSYSEARSALAKSMGLGQPRPMIAPPPPAMPAKAAARPRPRAASVIA